MKYWPFLTGRVRRTGHRVVAVPDFLSVDQARELLGPLPASEGGFSSEQNEVLRRVVRRSPMGPLTVFYQVIEATAEQYGVSGEGVLHDQHGRPILVTEGIVVQGAHPRVFNHDIAAALRRARAVINPAFREFWDQDEKFTHVSVLPQEFPSSGADNQSAVDIIDMPGLTSTSNRPVRLVQRVLRKRLLAWSFVVLTGLVAGIAGWLLWPHDCGGAFSGIRLNDKENRECIGTTDGSYLFNDPGSARKSEDRKTIEEINAIQKKIESENKAVAGTSRYVKIVLLAPLTVSQAKPSAISLKQIAHSLQGSYTGLVRANESTDFGDPSTEGLQLLLANEGSQQETGTDFMDGIMKMSQPDHPVVAVIGLGASMPNTRATAEYLAQRKIPMVSAVASVDDLTNLPLLWSVSPSNLDYARALSSFLDRQSELKSGVIVYDQNADFFAKSPAKAYHTELERYVKFPDQPFRGSTVESPAAPNLFGPVITNLCNAANDQHTPLDMVVYAGRGVDFGSFIEALNGAARTCRNRPLAVLTTSAGFNISPDQVRLLRSANVTIVGAASLDPTGWGKNEAGTPPGYGKFLTTYHSNGFLDDADLADGYAIAHHDALVTAAQAIRLAAQERPAHLPNPQDVISGFGLLSLAYAVPAASGTLTFPPEGGRATGQTISIQQIH